jgi:hypothetical protein
LITVLRDRLVSRRLACTVARWPRPNRERLPELILPERETLPPARWAAASAWAMKGRACCARVDRMRPGRMRKSSSPLIAGTPHIVQTRGNPWRNGGYAGCADQAHLAPMRYKSLKKHDRTKPHIARFYLAIVRLCCLLFPPLTPIPRQSPTMPQEGRSPSSRPRSIGSRNEQAI